MSNSTLETQLFEAYALGRGFMETATRFNLPWKGVRDKFWAWDEQKISNKKDMNPSFPELAAIWNHHRPLNHNFILHTQDEAVMSAYRKMINP